MRNVTQGQLIRLTANFKSLAGVLVDPTTVQVEVYREADGDSETNIYGAIGSDLLRTSTGIYYIDVDTTALGGIYNWRFTGGGTGQNANQGSFYVAPDIMLGNAAVPTIDLGTALPSYTYSGLPTAGTAGTLARVSDNLGGVWMDNGTEWVSLSGSINAAEMPGANAGAKIAVAIGRLPSTGGVVNATGFQGDHTITANMFDGVTNKPITLIFGNATFTYSAKQILPSNLTMRGAYGTTFIQAALSSLTESFISIASADNIHLEGFTVDGNMVNNSGPSQAALVKLRATSTNCSVRGVTLQNFYGLTGSTGVALYLASVVNTVVEKCTILNCGATGHVSDGIYCSGVRSRVVNNYISGITDTAIPVDCSTDVVVSGNEIVSCVQAIAADSAIASSTGTGVVIANNICTDCGPAANGGTIWVFKSTGTANNRITVSGNIIKGTTNSRGILVEDSNYVIVKGNIVTDTTVLDGIRAYNCSNIKISDNSSDLSGLNGIFVHACTNASIADNTANDNSGIGVGSASGIRVLDGSNIHIADNDAHDTRGGSARQAFGLLIGGTADTVFVTDNDVRFNLTNPGYSNTSSGNVRRGFNQTNNTSNTVEAIDYLQVAGRFNFTGMGVYADDAAAAVGSVPAGDFYQTAAGAVRVKL